MDKLLGATRNSGDEKTRKSALFDMFRSIASRPSTNMTQEERQRNDQRS